MFDTQKSFGVCVIDYEQMQARVNGKYDVWQGDNIYSDEEAAYLDHETV